MSAESNPFAVLSLIVAPALLTNASSLLVMSTSGRLARAVDRARELAAQLERSVELDSVASRRRLYELAAVERRSQLLLSALRSLYVALGGFAAAALVSLLGAVVAPSNDGTLLQVFELVAVAAGLGAVGALIHGSAVLVRETRIAVYTLHERTAELRERAEQAQRRAEQSDV